MSHDGDEVAMAASYAAMREGRVPPPPPTPAELLAIRRGQVAAIAYATGRDAPTIAASIRHVRVVGMPAGWSMVVPRFGGVSLGALMRPEIAQRSLERMRKP